MEQTAREDKDFFSQYLNSFSNIRSVNSFDNTPRKCLRNLITRCILHRCFFYMENLQMNKDEGV
jgi:hypothetical protein